MLPLPLLVWIVLLCRIPESQTAWHGNKRKVWRHGHHGHHGHHRQPELVPDRSPFFSLLAPAKLRLGTKQNILLEAENVMEATRVDITIYDFPASSPLVQDHVILSSENNYHALKTIQIDTNALQSKEKKYVRLVAKFGRYHQEEKVMKVSFKSGYIFIQTDKPLYNPGDTVRCRAFVSNLEFRASENTISLEIQNPDGIAVHGIAKAKALDGILSQSYPLPAVLKEGKWKVVAKFDQEAENTFSREFEVKKYVLPAFNVTLILQKPHLSLQDEKLEVEVTARYLHGEPVQGLAYVLFGIEMNNEKKRISTMKQISNLNGGSVSLSLEEIKRVYPDTNALLRASIYIKASVITRSGFDIVEAEKSGIKIVRSPYVLSVRDTPRYFKPGLPFDLTVTISNHEGSPVPNVPVKISHETLIDHHNGIIKVSINMPDESRTQLLRVETVDTGLKPEQQAVEELSVDPYSASNSHSSNYLHISVGSNQVKVGDVLKIQALIKTSSPHHKDLVEHLNYAVLNKGKIVHAGRLNIKNMEVIVIPLLVTAEMLPAFRLVAYYMLPWQNKAEVVADSLFVDVVDRCVGSLTVGPVDGAGSNSYPPGSTFKLQIKGDAGAKVSLVAVDNAIFLLSKSRLTQKKIWEIVDQGDMGCTTGGGKDSMGVLSDAGLAFYSSRQISTIEKKGCSRHSRKRRSAARLQRKEQLEKEYTDKVLQRCCVDGMRAIPMPYSCVRRSLYITEDESCVAAFLRCCAQFRGEEIGPISRFLSTTLPPSTTTPPIKYMQENGPKIRLFSMPLARGIPPLEDAFIPSERLMVESSVVAERQDEVEEDEEDEFDEDELDYISDIYVRAKFFESWLWTDVTLPAKSSGESVYQVDTVLPDSITQWGFLAISASPQTGFCVADPYNIQAWKPFFIDLRLPHSVSRNEHVEIKAIVHNYKSSKLEVMVILDKTEDMCSVAFSAPHRQQVSVQPASSTLVSYTIIPLKTGELPIQVTALAASFSGQDAVRKNLHVVVEGVQIIKVRSFVLDPVEKGDSDGRQQVTVDEMQMVGVVPKSLPETFLNVRGDLLADSIDNSINEDALAALIRMPGGCVEQNLASMTLPLIAAHYLDRSQKWDSVGVHRRDEAIKYIQRGYTNQLNYRKRDGSYPPYRNEGTSTWISAYVVKVFSMARSFIDVSEGHLCGPLLFILKNKQRPDGSFQEDNPVYTTSMTGGLHGSESQVSLSAFVLIALAEAQNSFRCSSPGFSVEDNYRKATEYLQEQYPRLKRPYTAALACYALALSSGGCTKSTILSFASPDGSHWPEPGNHFFTLEATGYALLALVKGGHMDEAAKPFGWLSEQRGVGGGYGSTQSTMVVLQALSEYLVKKSSPTDLNLLVELSVSGRRDVRWTFNPKMSSAARTSSVPLDQNFTVVASGNGKGILEVVTVYHQLPDVYVNSTCNGFQLDVSITEASETPPPDVEKSYRLIINVRTLEEHQARMVILDIGLPTGFEPENSDLELLSNSVDRYINNFQVVDNLSDRGSLIIHLFKVSSSDTDMISFRLHQKFKVGLLQPSIVTAYQYYNKDKRCSRFYSPPDDKEQLDQICKDDVCRCAHGDCCVMKADSSFFDAELRKASVCSGLHHAYKAKLTSISLSHIDQYEMEIVQMIKEGLEEGLREKDKRSFLSHASCRSGLPFREGQEYLIIGPIKDVWQAGRMSADRHVYILGKDTWVERWPTADECRDDSTLRVKCAGLESFANALTLSGCHT